MRAWLYWTSQNLAIRWMNRWADAIVVLCEEDRQTLIQRGLHPERIAVISGGVDMEMISRYPNRRRPTTESSSAGFITRKACRSCSPSGGELLTAGPMRNWL